MSLDESECLGCVYFYPLDNPSFDVLVIMWVRESQLKNGLDDKLVTTVKDWLESDWPFKKIAYPGRDHEWSDFC